MKQQVVSTPVEQVGKLPAGASCFVEVEGSRLRLKVWHRGRLVKEQLLRETALPVGRYEVADGTVVHHHEPAKLLAELEAHQRGVRLASPAFVEIAKQIAKRVGGKLTRWERDDGGLLGYRIARRSSTGVASVLAKLRRALADELVVVFRAGPDDTELGLSLAADPLALIPTLCEHWSADVETLIGKVVATCGATLVALDRDLIHLALAKAPRDPQPLVRLLQRLADETGLEYQDDADYVRGFARRELFLWWD